MTEHVEDQAASVPDAIDEGTKVKKNKLDRIEQIASIVGSVALPIVLLIVGNCYTRAVHDADQDRDQRQRTWDATRSATLHKEELRRDYVRIAIDVLRQPKTPNDEDLRIWATDVVNTYAEIHLKQHVINQLRTAEAGFPQSEPSTPMAANPARLTAPTISQIRTIAPPPKGPAYLNSAIQTETVPANVPQYGGFTAADGQTYSRGVLLALRADAAPSVVSYSVPTWAKTFTAVVTPYKAPCDQGGGGVINGWSVQIAQGTQ